MGFKRVFAKEAQDDINHILNQEQSTKNKERFVQIFDTSLDLLDNLPNMGKPVYKDFRAITFMKIPFKFVYKVVSDSTLFVLGVFHQKRDPKHWKDRADKY